MTDIHNLRQQIETDLREGFWAGAHAKLQQAWWQQPTSAAAAYVMACAERLREHRVLLPCRLAILRSFTIEPVVPILRAASFLADIDVTVQVGAFNAYAQEVLDPASSLYAFSPDVAILCLQTRDVVPEIWEEFSGLTPEKAREVVDQAIAQFHLWFSAFRRNSSAHVIVHTFERPGLANRGILDHQSQHGQGGLISELNHGLHLAAAQFQNIYLLDYEGLMSRYGKENWHDQVKWLTTRLPISAACLPRLAEEWLRYLHALGAPVKALVVDLDNTLWGGLAGEDELEAIRLGREYPGAAYLGVQRAILDLYHRGILLAISSKNNSPEALRVIDKHPGMLLRQEHFSALRINWNEKVRSLREIAIELNIGTDSLAFLDDNPVERERVRLEMPEVKVIELPENPVGFEHALRSSVIFERLEITAEDREKTRQYREQRERSELAKEPGSLETFYRSLAQRVEIAALGPESLARVAQLTHKTNQFNLTTKRYTAEQILQLAASPGFEVYSARVRDRFGDNGIVGVIITRTHEDTCEIDTLLLSCRVIGRTVETALLAFITDEARRQSLNYVRGWFVPTRKNQPAEDFYRRHEFRDNGTLGDATRWLLDLRQASISCPGWIDIHVSSRSDSRSEQPQFLTEYAAG